MFKNLENFFQTNFGQELLRTEIQLAKPLLHDLYGHHALYMGLSAGFDLMHSSKIKHQIFLDRQRTSQGSCLQADYGSWPLREATVDLIVLFHVLDFAPDPQEILKEAYRCLFPEGHLLVIGFNPYSFFRLQQAMTADKSNKLAANYLSAGKLNDWLLALDFEPQLRHYACHHWPGLNPKIKHPVLTRIWPASGACYALLAKKRVSTLTPVKPKWQLQEVPVAGETAVNRSPTTMDLSDD